jgi:predicted PurR-regulated permease PerM
LLVGGQLGGAPGVILAVPMIAVFRILCDERPAGEARSPVALVKT